MTGKILPLILHPSTLNPRPHALDPRPQTLTPIPDDPNPKPQTPNPEPQTPNPELESQLFLPQLVDGRLTSPSFFFVVYTMTKEHRFSPIPEAPTEQKVVTTCLSCLALHCIYCLSVKSPPPSLILRVQGYLAQQKRPLP